MGVKLQRGVEEHSKDMAGAQRIIEWTQIGTERCGGMQRGMEAQRGTVGAQNGADGTQNAEEIHDYLSLVDPSNYK